MGVGGSYIRFNAQARANNDKEKEYKLNGMFQTIYFVISGITLVVGAEYTEDFGIQHTVISSKEQIKKLRQSKYAQSNLNDVFTQIKELLKKMKEFYFVELLVSLPV